MRPVQGQHGPGGGHGRILSGSQVVGGVRPGSGGGLRYLLMPLVALAGASPLTGVRYRIPYETERPSVASGYAGSSMLLWLSNRRWGRLAGSEPVLVSGGEVVVVVSAVFECGDAAGVGSDGLGGLGQGDAALLASGA